MDNKHYLFFVSLSYAYSILRPLQNAIWQQGNDVAWFIEEGCENWLQENEKQLRTIQQVMDYNPIAVFVPGNWVYDFFPGVKVAVFHGYAMKKRIEIKDLRELSTLHLIEIHTITDKIIPCRIRNISTTSSPIENSHSVGDGILGYTLLHETENDIHMNKLELIRSVPFNQIKSLFLIY